MIAVLGLESIGDDKAPRMAAATRRGRWADYARYASIKRPWVARITGRSAQFGLVREFVKPKRDYSEANRTGSRGIVCWFELDEGVYEVHEALSWKSDRRYFCRSDRGLVVEVTRAEVDAWLDAQATAVVDATEAPTEVVA